MLFFRFFDKLLTIWIWTHFFQHLLVSWGEILETRAPLARSVRVTSNYALSHHLWQADHWRSFRATIWFLSTVKRRVVLVWDQDTSWANIRDWDFFLLNLFAFIFQIWVGMMPLYINLWSYCALSSVLAILFLHFLSLWLRWYQLWLVQHACFFSCAHRICICKVFCHRVVMVPNCPLSQPLRPKVLGKTPIEMVRVLWVFTGASQVFSDPSEWYLPL